MHLINNIVLDYLLHRQVLYCSIGRISSSEGRSDGSFQARPSYGPGSRGCSIR